LFFQFLHRFWDKAHGAPSQPQCRSKGRDRAYECACETREQAEREQQPGYNKEKAALSSQRSRDL
jgi:hypothetical protein